ncbi:SgcJ/EcaC family oxidoreductase [Sphaerisporangium sp. B11E5]|uniref:SgcJ/EcaC family oxidoreductase n=1 Tax=Sphaerisporangium sp. B11E5 TaxID=3153563 RepID=UPI00325CA7F6
MTALDAEAETAAIKQVVAAVEHSQRTESPEAFVALFRHDAIWTTSAGKRLIGRDEISAFTHQVLPGGMKNLTATYEVTHILFIRPDVAAVKIRQRYLTLPGHQPAGEGTPLYVMSKENGRWLMTACQNTGVPDE